MCGGSCSNILTLVRESRYLVVIIVFLSLFTDSLLLTLVDPILPDIVRNIENTSSSSLVSDNINTNGRYGYLVAAKGAAQFICNPFVGLIVTRFGYRRPMLIGDIVLLLSTVAFGYGASYTELFITRIFQGASSAVTAVTGMGLLASTFTEDHSRGKVMGVAIGGLSLGIIVGPIYGSVVYQFFGQAVPFLILAATVGLAIVLQLLTLKVDFDQKDHSFSSMLDLVRDPYILIVAGNIFLLNLDVSVILAFLPIRLIDLEDPPTWKLGIVVLPTSLGYLVSSVLFPRLSKYIKRWLCGLIGLVISTGTLVALAFCVTFESMLVTTTFLGFALGMVSTSMQPIFAQLVDSRHSCVYGNVYAISDMSVCAAMFLGPLVGGPMVYTFGFEWLVICIGILNLCFAQFSILLRDPPDKRCKGLLEEVYASDSIEHSLIKPDKDENLNTEKTPLRSARVRQLSGRSTASHRPKQATMNISHVPIPRYMECLSGVEDFYSDSDYLVEKGEGYETW